MKSLSSVALGLSVVFGCLFLVLVAELYYLLWWKKRFTNRDIENDYTSPTRELFYMFCWKKSSSLTHTALIPQEIHNPETQFHSTLLKPFGEDGIEIDFMRPRFLFTIIEETKEDLESEDGGKGSRSSRSLSDLLLTVETPYLTPLTSPAFFTPPHHNNPIDILNQYGFDPLFESASDAEFNRIRSSPPPKFKFLLEAEEKLRRKVLEEDEKSGAKRDGKVTVSKLVKDDEENESYITIIVDKNKDRDLKYHNSTTSQVLPLSSPPSTLTSEINKKPI